MTDVENLIITGLTEIRTMQAASTAALISHMAEDGKTFTDIKIMFAEARGRMFGFITAISVVGGMVGAIVSVAVKHYAGW